MVVEAVTAALIGGIQFKHRGELLGCVQDTPQDAVSLPQADIGRLREIEIAYLRLQPVNSSLLVPLYTVDKALCDEEKNRLSAFLGAAESTESGVA